MEVLKVLIWPITTMLIVFGLAWWFRTSIRSFFSKLTRVKVPGGVEFESHAGAQIATDPETVPVLNPPPPVPVPVAAAGAEEVLPPPSAAIAQLEGEILAMLEADGSSERHKRNTLVRALAGCRVLLAHEMNYRVIFGTQIQLLKAVNDLTIRDETGALFWYNAFCSRAPSAEISFADWLGFLERASYLAVGKPVADRPATLAITATGKDFLQWLVGFGISENRPQW